MSPPGPSNPGNEAESLLEDEVQLDLGSSAADAARLFRKPIELPMLPWAISELEVSVLPNYVTLVPSHSKLATMISAAFNRFDRARPGIILASERKTCVCLTSPMLELWRDIYETFGSYAGLPPLTQYNTTTAGGAASSSDSQSGIEPRSKRPRICPVQGAVRPDEAVYFDSVLVLSGEDEVAGLLGNAIHDHVTRFEHRPLLPAIYGKAPYLLLYAAAGSQAQFGVYLASGKVEMCAPIYDVSNRKAALEFLAASLNVLRVARGIVKLVQLAQQAPGTGLLPMGVDVLRPESTLLRLEPTHLVKEVHNFASFCTKYGTSFQNIQAAHSAESPYKPKGTVVQEEQAPTLKGIHDDQESSLQGNMLSIQMFSIGRRVVVQFLQRQDMGSFILGVLLALDSLHSLDLVHRDLRWLNVMVCTEQNSRSYPMLIDFELATKADQVPTDAAKQLLCWQPSEDSPSPEVLKDGQYKTTSDLVLVSRMMGEWAQSSGQQLGEELSRLREMLRQAHDRPEMRARDYVEQDCMNSFRRGLT